MITFLEKKCVESCKYVLDLINHYVIFSPSVPVSCTDVLKSYPSVSWSGDFFIYSKENNTWDRVKCVHSPEMVSWSGGLGRPWSELVFPYPYVEKIT